MFTVKKIKDFFRFFYFGGPTTPEFGDLFWKTPKIFKFQVVLGARPLKRLLRGHQEESLEV